MQFIAVLFVLTLTSVSPTSSQNACSAISNNDCSCIQSNTSSPSPTITCTFETKPPAPLFTNLSSTEPITLGTLDLSRNNLDDLPEDFFGRYLQVEKLVLKSNNLTRIPEAVKTLGEVKSLDVSDNKVDSMIVEILAGISGLEDLDLSGNSLESLSLGDDEQTLQGDITLRLTTLNLSSNGISSIDGTVFTSMNHLTSLDLSHNDLQEVTNTMFTQLEPSLVTLDLSNNALQRVQPFALQHLGHLRVLSLARNKPLNDVETLQFPQHIRSLDLSDCALTIINHCRLASLADLSYIGLSGNDLQCTCQLYLLLQWYQNQHHAADNADPNSMDGSWTCFSATQAMVSPNATGTADPHMSKVAELSQCRDTDNHCLTLEHAEHHQKGSSKIQVTLDVAYSSGTLMASWTFKENGEVVVDGFRLNYMPEDATPMVSPVIPADKRSYVMRPSELEVHFMVCLDVLAYETAVIRQECRSFKDESGNIVVGILAGVVFLVPCVVAMVYVFCKDHYISKASYSKVEEAEVVVSEKDAEKEPMETSKFVFHVDCSAKLKSACIAHDDSAEQDCQESVSSVGTKNQTTRESFHEAPKVSVTTEDETGKTQAVLNNGTPVATVDDIILVQSDRKDTLPVVQSPESNDKMEEEADGKKTTKAEDHDSDGSVTKLNSLSNGEPTKRAAETIPATTLPVVQSPESNDKMEEEADGKKTTKAEDHDSDGSVTKLNSLSNGEPTKRAAETIPATIQGVDNPGFLCGEEQKRQNASHESTNF
ncbi:leucine-rich repeat-containing protein let-4-like [Littorina saxatilis]|uniref:leucine-rich repeat-containing protein let-4-like n=1 Tax=Littorina saxatilis TaxID=31220 RepID=UPI0038B4FF87